MNDADVEQLRRSQCPACNNFGFIGGPRGGAGQNLYCANPGCRAIYLVAPRDVVAMAYRLDGAAPEHYYPPQVHIIGERGLPLCNFAGTFTMDNGPPPVMVPVPPSEWPVGHSCVPPKQRELCTCVPCRESSSRWR